MYVAIMCIFIAIVALGYEHPYWALVFAFMAGSWFCGWAIEKDRRNVKGQ